VKDLPWSESPDQASHLREHVDVNQDPDAAALVAALARTRAELAAAVPPAPPVELVARWHAALAQLRPVTASQDPVEPRRGGEPTIASSASSGARPESASQSGDPKRMPNQTWRA
jgi:hypothetical protein